MKLSHHPVFRPVLRHSAARTAPPTTQRRAGVASALGATLLAAAAPGLAIAQGTADLERVEVIRIAPLPGLDLRPEQVAAPVQTATGADLQRSGALGIGDFAGRRLGSVHVTEVQNNPFQPDINFRGFTASPLLGTPQGLSVYLDGVRLNQPFGDVVSWDLIPKAAIASITLIPGSNPLYGLNTLGGALAVQTRDGLTHPGGALQVSLGSHGRRSGEFEAGGAAAGGSDWYVAGQSFADDGWRDASPSRVRQLFGKLGWQSDRSRTTLSAALSDTDLYGNGLQEQALLTSDRASVYTRPDQTRNRAALLNLSTAIDLDRSMSLSANAYWRRIETDTLNGDINEASLDQSLYALSASERAALRSAGIVLPAQPITPANTPFPYLRCIAQALLSDEPGEKCNGLLNRSSTRQHNQGLSAQLAWKGRRGALAHKAVAGGAVDASRVRFRQGTQLGYLAADRGITGIDAFADGASGGSIDGEPFDNRVDLHARTTTWSIFGADTISYRERLHLTLSGRYNRIAVRSRDQLVGAPDPRSLDGDHRFARFNPALGITWVGAAGLQLYAGYNEGSRAPTAIELGCANPANPCKLPNAMAGDPPLRQVVTKSFEAGLRGALAGGGNWHAGVFRADNADDLLFVAAPDGNGFGYFRNFGRTRRQGIELSVERSIGPARLALSFTELAATYRSEERLGGAGNSSNDAGPGLDGTILIHPGDRIPLVPRRQLKASAEIDLGRRWNVDLDLVGVSGSFARGNEDNQHRADGIFYLGPGRSAGYAVVNLGAAYRPSKQLRIFARIDNLFDRDYSTAAQLGATGFDANGNFQARPFPRTAAGDYPLRHSTFFAPGAPRSVQLGVRYEWR